VGFLAKLALDFLLHARHAGHAADEDHFVDLGLGEPGIAQAILHRRHAAVDQVADELLELRAAQRHVQVLGPAGVGGDERQVDVRALRARQLALGLFRGFLQALEGHRVLGQVDAVLLLELRHQPIHDALVEVVAAQVRVAVGGLHLEHAVADFQHGDVERAAAEIVHGDLFFLLLVEAVGQRGRGRLVDDAQHFEACDAARVLGRLPLAVVEVRRHGDDRLGDRLAQERLGVRLHLLQDHRGNFRRRLGFVADLDVRVAVGGADDFIRHALDFLLHFLELAAHEALDGEDRVLRIGHGLALGRRAHQPLPALRERHDRGRRAPAFRVRHHGRLAAFHDRHAGIRRSQIDAQYFCHWISSSFLNCVAIQPFADLDASNMPRRVNYSHYNALLHVASF
jgi:hypothetical protein